MDTFVDSSWYQYRYVSPQETPRPFDPDRGAYWLPVDQYTGGIEHAVMHLMYTRFWTRVMRDMGLVTFSEPMTRLFNQGVILGEDGEKMSKSRGNVVNPDDFVSTQGADTVRAYLMFIGPWDGGGPWNSRGIEGVHRFLHRVWALAAALVRSNGGGSPDGDRSHPVPAVHETPSAGSADGVEREITRRTHATVLRVTRDLQQFRFNTAIAAMMELVNALQDARVQAAGTMAWATAIRSLILMLAPIAPHIAEELWSRIGGAYSVHQQSWPEADPRLAAAEEITLVIQVNGKVRDRIQVPADIDDAQARHMALESEKVRKVLDGREIAEVIVVPRRLVNVVLR